MGLLAQVLVTFILHMCVLKIAMKNPKNDFTCRNMHNYSIDILREQLVHMNLDHLYSAPTIEGCWEALYNFYVTCLDVASPYVEMKNQPEREMWTTQSFLSQIISERDDCKVLLVSKVKNIPDTVTTIEEYNEVLY